MNENAVIYLTNMGTTFDAIGVSLKEFNLKMKDSKASKFLMVFYGAGDERPKKNAEQVRQIFGPEFDHIDLVEIEDPEDIDTCVHTMKRRIEALIEEHSIESPVLYVNCTAGTKSMVFALAYATLWLVPSSSEFHLVYQGGERGIDGRVVSSEQARVLESELKNLAVISLSLNEFLKKRFNAAANYLNLLSVKQLDSVERMIYHGVLTTYYFSIFNFDTANRHLESYLKVYDPNARSRAGALQKSLNTIVDTVQVLKNPIEIGIELKSIVESLEGEQFAEKLSLAKQKIAEKWQSYVGFLLSLVALATNKKNTGEFTESVMLSYRIAELAVQINLLRYGISVWNFSESIRLLKPVFAKAVLERLECPGPDKLEVQVGFKRALLAFLSLRNLSKDVESAVSNDCLKFAGRLQSNRNYCFMAHGFDYKDSRSAESALEDLKNFLLCIRIVRSRDELEAGIDRFSILFR